MINFARRVATIEFAACFRRRYATQTLHALFPALKSRAKFNRRYASKTLDQSFLKFIGHLG